MSKQIDKMLKEVNPELGKNDQQKAKIWQTVKSLISLIIVLTLIMTFGVRSYIIPSGSMEKTLLIGDMLLGNKFIYGFRTPDWIGIPFTSVGFNVPFVKFPAFKAVKRGDIVMFKSVESDDNIVKRCVGIAGDTIYVENKVLFVNGKLFEDFYQDLEVDPANPEMRPKSQQINPEIYPKGAIERHIFNDLGNRDNFGPVVVPAGKYFMMGDNRDNSYDSRYWGFLPEENIIGKPIMIYFSYTSTDQNGEYISNLFKRIRWERIGYFIQ